MLVSVALETQEATVAELSKSAALGKALAEDIKRQVT